MELLRGVEYAHSNQKRVFDRFAALLLAPPRLVTRHVLLHEYRRLGLYELEDQLIFVEPRVGPNGVPFMMEKFRTLRPPENRQPISPLTEWIRQKGLDETQQTDLLRRGVMSMIARRALRLDEQKKVYETASNRYNVAFHQRLTLPTKGGVLSEWGIVAHTQGYLGADEADLRIELENKGVVDGSLVYDMGVILKAVQAAAANELLHSNHPRTDVEITRPEIPPDHRL